MQEEIQTGDTSFKLEASGHAFKVLSDNIYSRKVDAVLRELGCNARDSHIDAGKEKEPFWVVMPNPSQPNLIIRDFGTGLSNDQVMGLYVTYFKSTKTHRTSDAVTGFLGLGSKSPLSIADNFTVDSFFNGVRSLFLIFRDDQGCPQCSLIESQETSERNGLKISIPIKTEFLASLGSAIVRVFTFFDVPPTILTAYPEKEDQVKTLKDTHHGHCEAFHDMVQKARVGEITPVMYKFQHFTTTSIPVTFKESMTDLGTFFVVMSNVAYPVNLGSVFDFYENAKKVGAARNRAERQRQRDLILNYTKTDESKNNDEKGAITKDDPSEWDWEKIRNNLDLKTPYTLPGEFMGVSHDFSVSAFFVVVENRSLDFSPSREHLQYTKKTCEKIIQIIIENITRMKGIADSYIASFDDFESISLADAIRRSFGKHSVLDTSGLDVGVMSKRRLLHPFEFHFMEKFGYCSQLFKSLKSDWSWASVNPNQHHIECGVELSQKIDKYSSSFEYVESEHDGLKEIKLVEHEQKPLFMVQSSSAITSVHADRAINESVLYGMGQRTIAGYFGFNFDIPFDSLDGDDKKGALSGDANFLLSDKEVKMRSHWCHDTAKAPAVFMTNRYRNAVLASIKKETIKRLNAKQDEIKSSGRFAGKNITFRILSVNSFAVVEVTTSQKVLDVISIPLVTVDELENIPEFSVNFNFSTMHCKLVIMQDNPTQSKSRNGGVTNRDVISKMVARNDIGFSPFVVEFIRPSAGVSDDLWAELRECFKNHNQKQKHMFFVDESELYSSEWFKTTKMLLTEAKDEILEKKRKEKERREEEKKQRELKLQNPFTKSSAPTEYYGKKYFSGPIDSLVDVFGDSSSRWWGEAFPLFNFGSYNQSSAGLFAEFKAFRFEGKGGDIAFSSVFNFKDYLPKVSATRDDFGDLPLDDPNILYVDVKNSGIVKVGDIECHIGQASNAKNKMSVGTQHLLYTLSIVKGSNILAGRKLIVVQTKGQLTFCKKDTKWVDLYSYMSEIIANFTREEMERYFFFHLFLFNADKFLPSNIAKMFGDPTFSFSLRKPQEVERAKFYPALFSSLFAMPFMRNLEKDDSVYGDNPSNTRFLMKTFDLGLFTHTNEQGEVVYDDVKDAVKKVLEHLPQFGKDLIPNLEELAGGNKKLQKYVELYKSFLSVQNDLVLSTFDDTASALVGGFHPYFRKERLGWIGVNESVPVAGSVHFSKSYNDYQTITTGARFPINDAILAAVMKKLGTTFIKRTGADLQEAFESEYFIRLYLLGVMNASFEHKIIDGIV